MQAQQKFHGKEDRKKPMGVPAFKYTKSPISGGVADSFFEQDEEDEKVERESEKVV